MQVTTRAVDPSAVTLATLTGMPAVHRRPPDRHSGGVTHAPHERPVTALGRGARGQMALPGLTLTQYLTDA